MKIWLKNHWLRERELYKLMLIGFFGTIIAMLLYLAIFGESNITEEGYEQYLDDTVGWG